MANDDIEKVGLNQLAEEWLGIDELSLINQIYDATADDTTLYVGIGQQCVIIRLVRGRVHFRVSGTLSRRRAVTLLLGLAVVVPPTLDHIVQFVAALFRHTIGP